MKRLWALLCVILLMATGMGLAESSVAVEANDEQADANYDFEPSSMDGSEMLIFMMLDLTNDETTLVEKYGSIAIQMDLIDEAGDVSATLYDTLTDTDFGRTIIVKQKGEDFAAYSFADKTVLVKDDTVQVMDAPFENEDDFEDAWSNQYYPFAQNETLIGMTQEEDGTIYFRTRGTEGGVEGEFEYKVDEHMLLLQTKVFHYDADGNPQLQMLITYTLGEKEILPDHVIAVLEADKARVLMSTDNN